MGKAGEAKTCSKRTTAQVQAKNRTGTTPSNQTRRQAGGFFQVKSPSSMMKNGCKSLRIARACDAAREAGAQARLRGFHVRAGVESISFSQLWDQKNYEKHSDSGSMFGNVISYLSESKGAKDVNRIFWVEHRPRIARIDIRHQDIEGLLVFGPLALNF